MAFSAAALERLRSFAIVDCYDNMSIVQAHARRPFHGCAHSEVGALVLWVMGWRI
jgi:hypothetical protein